MRGATCKRYRHTQHASSTCRSYQNQPGGLVGLIIVNPGVVTCRGYMAGTVPHVATLDVLRSCFNSTEQKQLVSSSSGHLVSVYSTSDPIIVNVPSDVPAFTPLTGRSRLAPDPAICMLDSQSPGSQCRTFVYSDQGERCLRVLEHHDRCLEHGGMRTEAQQVREMRGNSWCLKRWLVPCGGRSLQAHECFFVCVCVHWSQRCGVRLVRLQPASRYLDPRRCG
jgi:hypothetical protein